MNMLIRGIVDLLEGNLNQIVFFDTCCSDIMSIFMLAAMSLDIGLS